MLQHVLGEQCSLWNDATEPNPVPGLMTIFVALAWQLNGFHLYYFPHTFGRWQITGIQDKGVISKVVEL